MTESHFTLRPRHGAFNSLSQYTIALKIANCVTRADVGQISVCDGLQPVSLAALSLHESSQNRELRHTSRHAGRFQSATGFNPPPSLPFHYTIPLKIANCVTPHGDSRRGIYSDELSPDHDS